MLLICLVVALLTWNGVAGGAHPVECPGDARYDVIAAQCRCRECPVERPVCPLGQRLERLHEGRGTPGWCCPDYGCVPELRTDSDCVTAICPQGAAPNQCPADSILVHPADFEDDIAVKTRKCCQTTTRCACKSAATCSIPACPAGQRPTIVKAGNNVPGTCCDNYTCVLEKHGPSRRNVSSVGRMECAYEGIQYQDGATWFDGNCTECQCKSGLAFCKHTLCARLTCDFPVMRNGECCAVCEGCLAVDGVSRADSEEWREDDCVQCRCQNGQIRCLIEECQTKCGSTSIKIPGQCCPVCNDSAVESVVLQPAHCVSLGKCKRLCRHGFTKHADGCFRCECQVENCTLSCEFGYETDAITGESQCACVRNSLDNDNRIAATGCQNTTSCNSSNCVLTRRETDGCVVCDCATPGCPEFRFDDCAQECTLGYQYDAKHCLTCECIQPPVTSERPELMTQPSPRPTLSSPPPSCDQSEENFVPWTEGCHECVCFQKKKMCDIILSDTNSTGQVCDSKNTEGQVQLVLPGFCDAAVDSATHLSCTECVCTSGIMYCAELRCPTLHCTGTLVQKPNQCCPSCRFQRPPVAIETHATTAGAGSAMTLRRKVKCQVSEEEIHESGSTWWATPCRSCTCTEGAVRCTAIQCPVLDCEVVTMQMGRCCPICFNATAIPVDQCQVEHKTYQNGEIWTQSECLLCTCVEGSILCKPDDTCDDKDPSEIEPETSDRSPGKAIIMILAGATVFAMVLLACVFLVKRWCRRHPTRRGHVFVALPTSESSSASHQGSQTPLSTKNESNSCFP